MEIRKLDSERLLYSDDSLVPEGIDFSGVNLAFADLRNISFSNCKFDEAILYRSDASGAHFRSCSFSNALLFGMIVTDTVFEECVPVNLTDQMEGFEARNGNEYFEVLELVEECRARLSNLSVAASEREQLKAHCDSLKSVCAWLLSKDM